MKLEQLDKLINNGRKILDVKTPVKRLFKTILYSHTGKRILKRFSEVRSDLKEDLELIFKPVKRFTAKQLKGVDATTLKEVTGTHTQNSLTNSKPPKSAGHKEVPANNGFVNWFDITSSKKKPVEKNVVSLRKSDGRVVPLDDYWLKD